MRIGGFREHGGDAQFYLRAGAIVLFIVLSLAGIVPSQVPSLTNTNSASPTPSPTLVPTPSPTPIPLSAIVEQADATTAKLQDIKVFLNGSPNNVVLQDEISGLANKVDSQMPETNDLIRNGISLDELNTVQREWDGYATTISGWKSDLQSQTAELDKRISDLKNLRDIWQRTLDSVTAPPAPAANVPAQPGDVVPEQLIRRINDTISAIDETQKLVEARRSKLLTFQTRVSDIETKVSSVTADIKESRSIALSRLFVRDNPAIWTLDWSSLSLSRISREIGASVSSRFTDLRGYANAHSDRFLFHGIFIVLLAAGLFWARRRVTPLVKKDSELELSANIFRHPVAAALLLSIFFGSVLYPQAPKLLSTLLGAAALVPVVILLRRLVDKPLFLILDILIGFYFFDRIRDVVAELPIVSRLFFIAEMLTAVGLLIWLFRSKKLASQVEAASFRGFLTIRRAIPFVIAIFSLALISNLLGFVGLGFIIGNGILRCSYAALILYTAAEVLSGLFNFAVRVRPLSDLRMMKDHRAMIRARVERLVRWLAVISWVYVALILFSIRDVMVGWLMGVLTAEIDFGSLSLSLGHIIVFLLAVWLAFVISRFIRFVLNEEVYPRMDLAAGISYAVSTMVHYVVLIVGFMIALAVLGVELSKFAIVAGAVGIGLGFGLQNIINNFVSGLILLFERPVKVGDSVQIGQHLGELKQIGLRASVLRKVDGSDVILPNSMLISDEVINWTMSDKRRRIDIPVGVAYGSDAKMVMELLTGIAASEPDILDDPSPVTLFKGFGDNSIDFELRGWTDDTEHWVALRSKLVSNIYAALNEANIEIPFPQRDLHLRSVDGEAAEGLKGEKGS